MIVIGIDNGLDGGVVAIPTRGALLREVAPTLGTGRRSYDLAAMVRILQRVQIAADGDEVIALLERAQAMPKSMGGSVGAFSMGFCYGAWQMALTALQIPFEVVTPQVWQKRMFVGVNRDDSKAASALVAQRLWPDVDWRASPRCRKPHDGLTDAVCIAEYGRRRMAGERAA